MFRTLPQYCHYFFEFHPVEKKETRGSKQISKKVFSEVQVIKRAELAWMI